MDEDQYRETYNEINTSPCIFERAILRRCGECDHAQRLNLAEREAVKCLSPIYRKECIEFLELVHEKSSFAIGLPNPGEKLPFGKEIKIQCGSITALRNEVDKEDNKLGIHALIQTATTNSGNLDNLPFERIIREISAFKSRRGKS